MLYTAISLFILGAITAYYYNTMRKATIDVEETMSNIDVMLKQRFDTLPNLIETVKGYAKHEVGTFEKVTKLRKYLLDPNITEQERLMAQDALSREIPNLLAVAEEYPDLKANENFLHLQHTINYLEENISAARRTYNAMIGDYNASIQTFPALLFAKLFNFHKKESFETAPEEKENIAIKF